MKIDLDKTIILAVVPAEHDRAVQTLTVFTMPRGGGPVSQVHFQANEWRTLVPYELFEVGRVCARELIGIVAAGLRLQAERQTDGGQP